MDDSMKQGIDTEAIYSFLKVLNDLVEMVSTFENIDFKWMVTMHSRIADDLLSLIKKYSAVVAKKLNEKQVVTL